MVFLGKIQAADLTNYFDITNIKACEDSTCSVEYNESNGVTAGKKFLIKFRGDLHSSTIIQDGDIVEFPFANEDYSVDTTVYDCAGFSWSNIYDENNNKIGQWKLEGNNTNRKISIRFSDYAVGMTDVSGEFVTPANIKSKYTYVDKIVPLTVGDKVKHIKIDTYLLPEATNASSLQNSNSSNNTILLQSVSPRITARQLYNTDEYPQLTNQAILSDLYFELFLPSDLNASINKISLISSFYLPVSISNPFASTTSANNFVINSLFTKVNQEEGETYLNFKNRLNKYEYGIFDDGENKTIVANYGNQPSNDLTYGDLINRDSGLIQEPGDYIQSSNPFTINSSVKEILNNIAGSTNKIGGKLFAYGMFIYLDFAPVKVETTKQFNGTWSYKNATGEVKIEQKSLSTKMVVPQSIVSVSGASQFLLRDKDSKNEIVGAKIKLQKKNGNSFEDVGEAFTDSSGMVMFTNLESGTYRYIQTHYLINYQPDSLIVYSNQELTNEITTFEFDASEGNIVYGTNEKMKYTITYLPGSHGNFDTQVFNNIPSGDPTPYYDARGDDDWIFKGWNPEREIYVFENKTYTALWSKLVKVTTKYLEVGTNRQLLDDIEDIKENGTEYTTQKKDIDNYEFVRVEGTPSGVREEDDITVVFYYKKKETNLNIKYLDCDTRTSIAPQTNVVLFYGDNYDSDTYEVGISIPENYNRVSNHKTDNYKGVVSTDSIDVEYCYNKKDSQINTSISKTGTDKITNSTDKISYKINYNTVFTDYIGSASINIIDTLPYKIDITSSNLDGGVYDEDNKTISWQVDTSINSYNSNTYNIEKNIELKYIGIDAKEDVITNNINGKTIIQDKDSTASTTYNTYIDIIGNITVKYLDKDTNNDLTDQIMTTNRVGKTYELIEEEFEGYKLVKKPDKKTVEYKEEDQEIKYLYERIKYNITITSNDGGSVTGDEEVYYLEDSTPDNINISASDGYYIKSISINNKEIRITEGEKKLTIPQFKKMTEDKNIKVEFSKDSTSVIVPNTLKKSILILLGVIITLGGIGSLIYIIYKKKFLS